MLLQWSQVPKIAFGTYWLWHSIWRQHGYFPHSDLVSIHCRSDRLLFCMQKWRQKRPTAWVICSQLPTSCRALRGYQPSIIFDCRPSCAADQRAILRELCTAVLLTTWTSDCGCLSAMQPALPMLWSAELSTNWSKQTSVLISWFVFFRLGLWWILYVFSNLTLFSYLKQCSIILPLQSYTCWVWILLGSTPGT